MVLGANVNCTPQTLAGSTNARERVASDANAYQQSLGQAFDFLTALASPYFCRSSAARLELRSLDDSRDPKIFRPRGWYAFDQLQRAAADALAWSAAGWDVYVGVLPRVNRGGKAKDLRLCGYLWCDIDGGDAGPIAALCLLQHAILDGRVFPPHIVVCSGGGIHCYWRLSEPVLCRAKEEQERVRQYMRRIVRTIGGEASAAHADLASTDPARILRVPGTHNHKRKDNLRAVELLLNKPEVPTHRFVEWGAHLPAEPLPPVPSPIPMRSFRSSSGSLPPTILHRMSTGVPQGMRHYEMRKTAIWARKEGLDEQVIRSYAEQVGVASGVPMSDPGQQRHLDQLVQWTMSEVVPIPGGSAHGTTLAPRGARS